MLASLHPSNKEDRRSPEGSLPGAGSSSLTGSLGQGGGPEDQGVAHRQTHRALSEDAPQQMTSPGSVLGGHVEMGSRNSDAPEGDTVMPVKGLP